MDRIIIFLKFNSDSLHNLIICLIICILIIIACYILGGFIELFKNSKEKTSFTHKHPTLNMIQGLMILCIMCLVIAIVLILLWKGFIKVLRESSKIDTVIVVALVTGILSIVSNIGSKYLDYRKSRQEYLAQKREGSYGQFVDMIYKIQNNINVPDSYTEKMMKDDIAKFSKEITLWGSSDVVKKWDQFRMNGNNPEKAQENLFIIEDLMNAMRKDLGVKRTKQGELLAFFVNDIKEVIEQRKK